MQNLPSKMNMAGNGFGVLTFFSAYSMTFGQRFLVSIINFTLHDKKKIALFYYSKE